MQFSKKEIEQEIDRLFQNLQNVKWTKDDCRIYAPLTLEINKIKHDQDAIILAHSYQTPDIMYGVADFVGDSYGLSLIAARHKSQKLIFCGVSFMAETAKILSPQKEVLIPDYSSCSLAESITASDVRELRKKYPQAAVVCYVNTTAAVKAESDICCTSSNVVKIVENLPQSEIIFIPDEYMAKNLRKLTDKTIYVWDGRCVVHEIFTPESIVEIKKIYPNTKILAHTECSPDVVKQVDFVGGTSGMLDYIKKTTSENYMIITECGITDRIQVEYPNKKIVGSCALCPYMKQINLRNILQVLKNPVSKQIITIADKMQVKAREALDEMFAMAG